MISNRGHAAWNARSFLALFLAGLILVSGAVANTKTEGSSSRTSTLRAASAAESKVKAADDDNPLEDDEEIPEGECDTDYECEFYYLHRSGGDETVYRYLLEGTEKDGKDGICNEQEDYVVNDKDGKKAFQFNVCGTTHGYCLPPNYKLPYIYGAAIQWIDNSKPEGNCKIPITNDTKPCTSSCEVLGKGRPIFELIEMTDPTIGFKLKHFGEPDMGEDGYSCPIDPLRNTVADRTVVYKILCDKTASSPFEKSTVSVVEEPACTYTFTLRSPYGCPTELKPKSQTKAKGDDSNGSGGSSHGGLAAGMFFFGFLLTGALLFAAWKYKQNGGNLKFWQRGAATGATPSSSNAFAPAGSSSYSTVRT